MAELLVCPNCQQVAFDPALNLCRNCNALGTTDTTIDDATLIGLLHNVRIRLADLGPDQFQQILGLFSERIGHSDEDGIPFTAETAALTHRYLGDHGIRCARIEVTANRTTAYSLVVAPTEVGIERCLRQARKVTQRQRALLKIVRA